MKVRYSPEALVFDFGLSCGAQPAGCARCRGKIKATIALLSRFPGMGRAVEGPGHVRVMPTVRYPYLIFYAVRGDEVLVLHIRHGARAPLQPDEL